MLSCSKRWTYVSTVLIIVLVISTSGLTVLYIDLNRSYSALQNEFREISSQVESLRVIVDRVKSTSNTSETHYGLTPQELYDLAEPSVVKVTVRVNRGSGMVPYAQGSGFIYSKDGLVVTNHHVVAGSDAIEVTYLDGATAEAKLVGADPYSDLAVIKVDPIPRGLRPLLVGDSSKLKVGDPVLAIGNPFGLSGSMTKGIVSQLNRTLATQNGYLIVGIVQTDAAINPGNSGGPLLNVWGQVIGINSAIASKSGEFSGVGFAIPSNLMVRVVSSLIEYGSYKHPWLGLTGVDVTSAIGRAMSLNSSTGFLVTYVAPESPVGKGGVRAGDRIAVIDGQRINIGGDVIIGIDNVKVRKLEDLLVYLEYQRRPRDKVTLTIIRDNKVVLVAVELGDRPPPG